MRDTSIRVRVNNQELMKLKAVAKQRDLTVSEVIRDLLKNLEVEPSAN